MKKFENNLIKEKSFGMPRQFNLFQIEGKFDPENIFFKDGSIIYAKVFNYMHYFLKFMINI